MESITPYDGVGHICTITEAYPTAGITTNITNYCAIDNMRMRVHNNSTAFSSKSGMEVCMIAGDNTPFNQNSSIIVCSNFNASSISRNIVLNNTINNLGSRIGRCDSPACTGFIANDNAIYDLWTAIFTEYSTTWFMSYDKTACNCKALND